MLSHITNNSGIYKITSPSGKVYIGEAINIRKRLKRYFRLECVKQNKLYNSFLKYGVINHTFEVIEECDINDLKCRERYWQDHYNVLGKNGLNLILTSCENNIKIWSEDVKSKMIDKLKQRYRDGLINAFKGKKHKKETIELLSKINKGCNNPSYGKRGKKAHAYGYRHTNETLLRMGEMRKGGKNPNAKIIIDYQTGIFYDSVGELSELIGVPRSTLTSKLNGHLKNNTNYKYC